MRRHHANTCLKLCYKIACFKSSFLSTLSLENIPETQFLSARKSRSRAQEFANLLRIPSFSKKPILYYKQIHAHLIVTGLSYHVFLGNILIHLYSKLDCIQYAHHVFDKMPKRNLVSWSTMVTVYSQHGYAEEALMVFSESRRRCDENPNEYVLASVLRACMQVGALAPGTQVHGFVVKSGLSENVFVGTSFTNFYSKIGDIDDARLVFDELKEKSLFTWTILMKGYAKSGESGVTLMLFYRMIRDPNVIPDKYVLPSALKACTMIQFLEGGKQIHAYVLRREGLLDVSVMNALVDFYVKIGRVECGRKLFDQIDTKDVISWTTMIAGYMQNLMHTNALQSFREMNEFGLKLDDFVCSSILNSCGSLKALSQGKQVHAYIIKSNLESDEYVTNGLIDMYSKCDSLDDARRAFDSAHQNSVVSYNAMIEGYSNSGNISKALHLFYDMMNNKRLYPNLLTYVSILGGLSSHSLLELSRQIHALIIKVGVSSNLFASSALIDVYCKCNFLKDARFVFNETDEKDIVMWNALLFGYTQHLENEEAIKLYNQLQVLGQKANDSTFVALLNAATNLASLRLGQQFHNQITKNGLDNDSFVRNALLDMYSKCGCLEAAYNLFNTSKWREIPSWNSMISTFANHGLAEKALSLYDTMLKEGLNPNYVTFIGLLSACSHAGLVKTGLKHFNTMLGYGITPGMEHYACMVSLFGRAGKLNDAKEFIEKMPIKPGAIVWRSLLSACRASGDYELGAYAAEMAISSEPIDSGSYILMSNIYASNGMWAEVKEIRERMESNLVVKEAGCSWIEINDKVESFVSRDKSHFRADVIFSVLDNLIKEMKGVGHFIHDSPFSWDDC